MANGSSVFVDTNVLLYAHDPRVPDKQAAAAAWLARCWQRGAGRISIQVLNEMYANLRRIAPALSAEDARKRTRAYRAWKPWAVDEATIDTAWSLQDRFELSYWDALIVASAQAQGCTILLSEDMQHEQRIDKLQIINPFKAGPELLDTLS